jgi:protein translocase SecG subunit
VYTLYTVFIGIGVFIAVLFSALVFLTGKGDAMSGGGGVRTTFKGKASFDDFMSRLTLYLGIGFMILMLVIDILGHHAVNTPK